MALNKSATLGWVKGQRNTTLSSSESHGILRFTKKAPALLKRTDQPPVLDSSGCIARHNDFQEERNEPGNYSQKEF
jgi:hypothetical protein